MTSFQYIVEQVKNLTIVGLVVAVALPYYHFNSKPPTLPITIDQNNHSTVVIENKIHRKNPKTGELEEGKEVGAGILIDNQYIITVRHLVNVQESSDGKNDFWIHYLNEGDDAKDHAATLVGFPDADSMDLMVLKLDTPMDTKLMVQPTFSCKNPNVGDDIYTIGAPSGFPRMIQFGAVSMMEIPYDEIKDKKPEYVINMNIFHGNSGGPIFERSTGVVVGLAEAIQYWQDEFGNHPSSVAYAEAPADMCALMNKFHISFRQEK